MGQFFPELQKDKNMIVKVFFFFAFFSVCLGSEVGISENRKAKLFFIATSSTTTTISTTTVCFRTSDTTMTTCTKRRRKRKILEPLWDEQDDVNFNIQPSVPVMKNLEKSLENDHEDEVESGIEQPGDKRIPRFGLYWKTTTKTSTYTSYTSSSTIASLKCTPAGFVVSNCG